MRNKTVICDRYIHSTYSYQVNSSNLEQKIKFLHKNFCFNLLPDLTFLLDIPFEDGINRSLRIKKSETRFERKNKDFHKKVRASFLKLSLKDKKIFKVDALLSKKKVHYKIIDHLNSKSFYKKLIPYSI